jgi:NADPH:quinone reductase-like Zn-dependent oxidoreductase
MAEDRDVTPSADQLLLAVEAISLNRGESFQLEAPPSGWRPGKDVAGRVLRAAAVGGPRAGTRVVAHLDALGWAERVAARPDQVSTLPDHLDATTAAALPLAGLTALRLLRAAGPVAARRVLVTGASGGVGHFFVELAAAQGAEITVVSRSARAERLLALGASQAVDSVEQAEGPFDLGLDSVGGTSTGAMLRRLSDGGRLIWFGQASREPAVLDFFDWAGGANATIHKFHYLDGCSSVADDLAALVRLTAEGRLHPEIGLLDSWHHADEALRALVARKVRGKVVLTVD